MSDRFDDALTLVLKEEGGWVNDPADPGGETNLGITRRVYEDWTGQKGVDMRHLTAADVGPIYLAKYWLAMACDRLPAGVDLLVFDSGVNCGPSRASRWLQSAVAVEADGKVGPATLAAVGAADAAGVLHEVMLQRDAHYHAQPTFDRFGKGWLARLDRMASAALEWAGA